MYLATDIDAYRTAWNRNLNLIEEGKIKALLLKLLKIYKITIVIIVALPDGLNLFSSD
jgi:hypothetical protein